LLLSTSRPAFAKGTLLSEKLVVLEMDLAEVGGNVSPVPEEGGLVMRNMTVRLEDELDERLEKLARQTGRTKSYYAKLALQEFLDEQEDYVLGIAALERKEPTITLDELEEELDLAR
jgi:RHH-type transcriptional regulator, rel operon repressor / antitoxin RelB